jgi:hypothetical protein
MTRSAFYLFAMPVSYSSVTTFFEARPAINAVTGMTFMTAARGIVVLPYAGPDPPDALTGECTHPTGESHRIEPRDTD